MIYILNQSQVMDAELMELLPEVEACQAPSPYVCFDLDGPTDKCISINQQIEVDAQDQQLKFMMEVAEEDSTSASQTFESSFSTKNIQPVGKLSSDEDSSSEYQSNSRQRSIRSRNGLKMKGYPTKNFLPNFKMPHLEHLFRKMSREELAKYPIVHEIHRKSGISMKDYQDLYNIEAFADVWRELFESRRLYLDLMISRSSLEAKKIHQKKIAVFERAFIQQEFKRIN